MGTATEITFAEIEARHSVGLQAVLSDANKQSAKEREERGVAAVKRANVRLSGVLMSAIDELKAAREEASRIKVKVKALDGGIKSEASLTELAKLGDDCYYLVSDIRAELSSGGVTLPAEDPTDD